MFSGMTVISQSQSRQDSRDTLATLASDTGGRAFFDLGDLSEAFPKIQQENGGYYLLGYYLGGNVKHDGRWRSVRVKVNAPGSHVHYRNGYYAPRDFQHLQKEDRQSQLVDPRPNRIEFWVIKLKTVDIRTDDDALHSKFVDTAIEFNK